MCTHFSIFNCTQLFNKPGKSEENIGMKTSTIYVFKKFVLNLHILDNINVYSFSIFNCTQLFNKQGKSEENIGLGTSTIYVFTKLF